MKCSACHSEYDEGTNHRCPLAQAVLGSWGSSGAPAQAEPQQAARPAQQQPVAQQQPAPQQPAIQPNQQPAAPAQPPQPPTPPPGAPPVQQARPPIPKAPTVLPPQPLVRRPQPPLPQPVAVQPQQEPPSEWSLQQSEPELDPMRPFVHPLSESGGDDVRTTGSHGQAPFPDVITTGNHGQTPFADIRTTGSHGQAPVADTRTTGSHGQAPFADTSTTGSHGQAQFDLTPMPADNVRTTGSHGSKPAVHNAAGEQVRIEIASPQRAQSNARDTDILEETLDFRFHVEKQEDPNIGKIISERYKIISLVGRGGMGMVYKADHMTIDRAVAIKMLYPNTTIDAEAVKRFKQEAQAVSKVEHPHSVRIYDFGVSDSGQPYIVMDFIDGGSLRDAIKESALHITRAEDIFMQVIDALTCAHKVGVIHRDLKPENIMLCERSAKQDWVSVVDFGISSFGGSDDDTMYGAQTKKEVRGSPPYMSPEQCTKGAEIDHRSDVYSLAVVLYETLSGKLPYNARTAFDWIEAHLSGKPVPLTAANPSLAACEALSALILKALEKNPERRFQSIEEFGSELKEAVRRDQIHLGYLKNRKDSLGHSSSKLPTLSPEEIASATALSEEQVITGRHRVSDIEGSPTSSMPAADKSIWKQLVTTFSNIGGKEEAVPEIKLVFTNCPHCGDPVEPDVAFCLACGRTLASSQDFSKVRAAQGVFTLPKGVDTLSASVPAFTNKKSRATGFAAILQSANRSLLVVSLILVICIFFFAGGLDWVAKAIVHLSGRGQ